MTMGTRKGWTRLDHEVESARAVNATMAFWADLGANDDGFVMALTDNLEGNANVLVRVMGGLGNDGLAVDARNDVDLESERSRLQVGLFGGADTDLISFYYRGENDGTVAVELDGQDGTDYWHYQATRDSGSDRLIDPPLLSNFEHPF